jgi:hypothetical protein
MQSGMLQERLCDISTNEEQEALQISCLTQAQLHALLYKQALNAAESTGKKSSVGLAFGHSF